MAQQPNIELSEAVRPRPVPSPGPAVRWRKDKPGIPDGPDDVPTGGMFGTTGPDPGWGLRILRMAKLPDDDPRLPQVLEGLVLTRSAELGRAPVLEDVDAGLALLGYGYEAPAAVLERRRRWFEAVPHEQRHGSTAVTEVDRELLVRKPAEIIYALRHATRS